MERNVEVRLVPSEAEGSQKSEVRIRAATVRERLQPLAPARGSERRQAEPALSLPKGMPVLLVLLMLVFSPGLRAQFTSGSTAVLGDFINPGKITVGTLECNYDWLQIDMRQGKAFARPQRTSTNGNCPVASTPTVEVPLDQIFSTAPLPADAVAAFADGVFDVANFTLRQTTLAGADNGCCGNVTLQILPNARNTPVIIRATGDVNINGSQRLTVEGYAGVDKTVCCGVRGEWAERGAIEAGTAAMVASLSGRSGLWPRWRARRSGKQRLRRP